MGPNRSFPPGTRRKYSTMAKCCCAPRMGNSKDLSRCTLALLEAFLLTRLVYRAGLTYPLLQARGPASKLRVNKCMVDVAVSKTENVTVDP